MKMFNSIKKEPRDLLEARLQQQSLMLGQVCKIIHMNLAYVTYDMYNINLHELSIIIRLQWHSRL